MSGPGPSRPSSTEPISARPEESIAAMRKAAAMRRLSLVVHHEDGVEVALLAPGAPLVVGREPGSGMRVPSTQLSREHARFTLDASGRVTVEDLGSKNGTWLRGTRVHGAVEITFGDEIVLGRALACLQKLGQDERPTHVSAPGKSASIDEPIAVAPAMREVIETALRIADSMAPVILHGETGTGKEVIARLLHERGPRADKPLVSVNCAAIPGELLESALFGHERGAFTGASQRQKGVFEQADGGTVFLDEIGELPLSAQAALLRVLEARRFSRVGSPLEIAVDVRVIAATHRDLEALRDSGAFRADLYYRLGVLTLTIPPLRDRHDDIEPLARRFLARGSRAMRDISPEALAMLRGYAWPGNIRELRNTIDRAVALARGDVIGVEDLPRRIRDPESLWAPRSSDDEPPSSRRGAPEPPSSRPPQIPLPSRLPLSPPPPSNEVGSAAEMRERKREYEAQMLTEALQATGWNQSEAARRLGMPLRTLTYKIKSFGLRKPGT